MSLFETVYEVYWITIMTYTDLDWWRSEQADEDALLNYIDGENDALTLDKPTSNDYYYLMGWHDTKEKLARGELTIELEKEQVNPHYFI
jgi:hypothetical protein